MKKQIFDLEYKAKMDTKYMGEEIRQAVKGA